MQGWIVKHKTAILGCLTALSGASAAFLDSLFILDAWLAVGWRRPVQDWMTNHGAGYLAGYFGILYIHIPAILLALIGGAVVGLLLFRRWWQFSLLYAGSMFASPYLLMTIDGSVMFLVNSLGVSSLLQVALLEAVYIPSALGGAWLASRPKRRHAELLATNRCLKCSYDLTGNESGICPECGEPITTEE